MSVFSHSAFDILKFGSLLHWTLASSDSKLPMMMLS